MNSFTFVLGLGCLAAIIIGGAHARVTVYGPEEKIFGFNEIADLKKDEVDFKKLGFNWRLVFERNGDFVGITVLALDDVSHLQADFSISVIQRSQEPLIEQHFHEDFTTMEGEKVIGSTKYMSYAELINPKRGLMVNKPAPKDVVLVKIKMELQQYPNF